ncbi:MAG: hypothetical protein U1E68_06790 [Sphingomonadaceae bacterium]|jgi:hypothetical protein
MGSQNIRKSGFSEKLHMDLRQNLSLGVVMDDRIDLIGALLSEAAGLLEEAASLAPLDDRTGLVERVGRIEDYARDALTVLAAVRVVRQRGRGADSA